MESPVCVIQNAVLGLLCKRDFVQKSMPRREEVCNICGQEETPDLPSHDQSSRSEPDVWIQCDICSMWFHLSCVGLEEYETVTIDVYHCANCQHSAGPSKSKRVLLKHRYKFDAIEEKDRPIQVGTPAFISAFCEREAEIPPISKEYAVFLDDGIGLTKEFDGKEQWTSIYFIHNKRGLGMGMPDDDFGVEQVVNMIGSGRMVSVIDVFKQQSYQMSLGQFYKHFTAEDRSRLYNILSLEFSDTRLNSFVTPPSIVSELSWVDRYWAKEGFLEKVDSLLSLEDHLKAKPEVSRYCLIGMAGSFTDFHIDFGGSSVWYHVFKGQKVFYLAPPTAENLKLYFDYHRRKDRSEIFFADKLKDDALFRVVVNSGETLLLPSGWIHAVLTPMDSLVFGGNFLHSLSVPMQLQVYEMEISLRTEYRLMFPGFELVNWYVASELVDQLREINQDANPIKRSDIHLVKRAEKMLENLLTWMNRKALWKSLFGDVVPGLQKELKAYSKKRQKEANAKKKSSAAKRKKKECCI